MLRLDESQFVEMVKAGNVDVESTGAIGGDEGMPTTDIYHAFIDIGDCQVTIPYGIRYTHPLSENDDLHIEYCEDDNDGDPLRVSQKLEVGRPDGTTLNSESKGDRDEIAYLISRIPNFESRSYAVIRTDILSDEADQDDD